MENNKQISESMHIGAVLAIVGGFLDIHTYIARGGVFANAQTGNIVLFGMHLTNGNIRKACFYLWPILSFAAGVFVSDLIKHKLAHIHIFNWQQKVVILEVITLMIVGLVPTSANSLANILVSFICAMQVEAFRKIHGSPYATTMCTGNLRSGMELLYNIVFRHEKSQWQRCLDYFKIIGFFIFGAIIGTISTRAYMQRGAIVAGLILIIAVIMLFREQEK